MTNIEKIYNAIFNGKEAYEYPFIESVGRDFIILGSIEFDALTEDQFSILKKYLFSIGENKIYVKPLNDDHQDLSICEYKIDHFDYGLYYDKYAWKGSHNIFWSNKEEGVSLFKDDFGLILGGHNLLNLFIHEVEHFEDIFYEFCWYHKDQKEWKWLRLLIDRSNFYNKDYLENLDNKIKDVQTNMDQIVEEEGRKDSE